MTTPHDEVEPAPPAPVLALGVTAVTPDAHSAMAGAMLVALLAANGENVAAMVPVETGVDDPCDAGSQGSLLRWAAGHMDDPRLVTPFALELDRSVMHAADAAGTLLHAAAFDRARDELTDGRTALVVVDAIGLLDPITPSLTMLDLFERWGLGVIVVASVSRSAVSHVRLLSSALVSRNIRIAGVMLTQQDISIPEDEEVSEGLRSTLSAALDCPVVVLPRVFDVHDRAALVEAARGCGLHRLVPGTRAGSDHSQAP